MDAELQKNVWLQRRRRVSEIIEVGACDDIPSRCYDFAGTLILLLEGDHVVMYNPGAHCPCQRDSNLIWSVTIMKFDVRYANHPEDSKRYDTAELRKHYHIANLFEKDSINLTYSHQDRIIAGGIMPVEEALVLESCKELAAPYFLARRELGAINVGGNGVMILDGVEYPVNSRDGIYV